MTNPRLALILDQLPEVAPPAPKWTRTEVVRLSNSLVRVRQYGEPQPPHGLRNESLVDISGALFPYSGNPEERTLTITDGYGQDHVFSDVETVEDVPPVPTFHTGGEVTS